MLCLGKTTIISDVINIMLLETTLKITTHIKEYIYIIKTFILSV